ncbi:MAG: cyclic nucleotide-binding domain-containing protein [Anaerolineales bacterium]|nr:cyclic nucleotide-binding domain-containing protein [Anaerolineales bacterium]
MNETLTLDKIALLHLAFNGLSDEELQEMAALTEFRAYPPEHLLCHEGAYEEIFYIIADGRAVISKFIGEGEGERVLRHVGKGDLIGEMALIQNAPRSATVRTLTDCVVLEMGKADFETMLSRSPRMALNIVRITLDRLRENDQMAIRHLQNTNKILRQLDRNKLEFIQVAAHELRTPLTVLKGYANLMRSAQEVKANPALVEVTEGILKGTDRLHGVVNTMLDVTRIDGDTLELRAAPVLLKRLIQDILADHKNAASERTIGLAFFQGEDTPFIHGDPALVHKAINHLVVNAIKYTPNGGHVTVRTRPVTMNGNLPGVEISVTDTGIGLDREHHDLVFEKFYQVGDVAIHSSGTTTFKGGGPGLGLAIVRGVVRAHGGKAWVESRGHDEVNFPGCTFYLQLPVEPVKTAPLKGP